MQDKRRRNDFASTEVGEATGGRVTQQAFDEKDSGISNAAMPGTRGDGRKEAHDPAPLSKGASLHSLPLGPSLVSGLGGTPGKTSSKQAQGFNFQLPPSALARASRFEHQQSGMRQQRRSNWRCNNSAAFYIIPNGQLSLFLFPGPWAACGGVLVYGLFFRYGLNFYEFPISDIYILISYIPLPPGGRTKKGIGKDKDKDARRQRRAPNQLRSNLPVTGRNRR